MFVEHLHKLCSNAGIGMSGAKGQYFTTLDDVELDKLGIEWLMSRVHATSRRHIIQSERMDPWEDEDRSSSGGGSSQLPSRQSRTRDHDQLIWRWNSFMGDDRELKQTFEVILVFADRGCSRMPQKESACCDLNSESRVLSFWWSTNGAPDHGVEGAWRQRRGCKTKWHRGCQL